MKIKGFTPVFDVLVEKYDTNTALVYGKIWRVCDWSPGSVCNMSNETIGEQLGLSEKTIRRKKAVLLADGLIEIVSAFGSADEVRVAHEIVMSMDILSSTSDNLSQTSDSLTNEDKDSIKIHLTDEEYWAKKSAEAEARPKAERMDKQELEAIAYGLKKPRSGITYPPDVSDLLIEFAVCFDRDATSEEIGYWTKTARSWKEAGITHQDVHKMFMHARGKGLAIKSPASITFAYDDIRQASGSTLADQRKKDEERYG